MSKIDTALHSNFFQKSKSDQTCSHQSPNLRSVQMEKKIESNVTYQIIILKGWFKLTEISSFCYVRPNQYPLELHNVYVLHDCRKNTYYNFTKFWCSFMFRFPVANVFTEIKKTAFKIRKTHWLIEWSRKHPRTPKFRRNQTLRDL